MPILSRLLCLDIAIWFAIIMINFLTLRPEKERERGLVSIPKTSALRRIDVVEIDPRCLIAAFEESIAGATSPFGE